VRARAALWPRPPRIVVGESEKFAAFRSARAALAASGTVTLELALAGVPLVGAYKVSGVEALCVRWSRCRSRCCFPTSRSARRRS